MNERQSVTPDMALRLSKAFDTSPELWLHKITVDQIKRLEKALASAREKRIEMDERIFNAMIAGIESQIDELKNQLEPS